MKDDLFDFSRKRAEPNEQKITLRYNRERRLNNASETVRKLYSGEYTKRRGLIGALFSTPASSLLALAIILMIPFIIFYKNKASSKKLKDFNLRLEYKIEEISDDASEKSNEERVDKMFAQVAIEAKSKNYSGENIKVIFFVLGENNIVLTYAQTETIYLAENLILSSPLHLNIGKQNIKAIKAQVEIAGNIFVLNKKIKF